MTKNGREDSGRHGIILGSEVVLKVDPQAAAAHARDDAEPDSLEGRAKGDQSLVLSTARTAERTLVALVDGKKTVQELVRVSGMSDLVVRRHLRVLCEAKVLVPATLPEGGAGPSTASREPGIDSVPRYTPAVAASAQNADLSKALSQYLDSGKTATVQASVSDAVTAKVTPASGPAAMLESTPPPKVVVVGVTGEAKSSEAKSSEAKSATPASPGPASGASPDSATAPQAGAKRTDSPPGDVITGEWPRLPNKASSFKPNVTAFWIPSSSELASVGTQAGAPTAPAASPTSAAGPASLASPGPAPVSAPAASRSSATAGPGPSPSTTLMWHKAGEPPLRGGRTAPHSQETIIVTGSSGATGSAAAVDAAAAADITGVDAVPVAGTRGRSAAIPFRLGEYEVATRIAQGGMGSIYVCRRAGATGPQRLFTLKVIRQHAKQVAQVIQSFRREARVGALLNHPNLQTVVHVGTYHEQPFLILDYIEGIGLSDLMASPKRLPPAIVVSVLVDVLRGLKSAHDLVDEQGARLGLVHGDISPQNILVGVDGNARLTDFGSARFSAEVRAPETAPVLMGKAAFMSPEQLCADPIDARTDLFSLGVVLWSALTGQSLFAADSYDEIVMNIFRKKIPPPSEFGAPACFDEILTTALSRAPEGRYSTADEMANALSRAARNEGIVGSPYDVGQWVRREFAETLAERRRRIQVVFGGLGTGASTAAAAGSPSAASPPSVDAAPAGAPENPGASSADGFARLASRTIQLPARRRSTPRLTALTSPEPMSRENRWRLVFVSAAIAFPFALALAYLVSNPLVKRVRSAHPPAATAGAPPLAPPSPPAPSGAGPGAAPASPPTATTAPGTQADPR